MSPSLIALMIFITLAIILFLFIKKSKHNFFEAVIIVDLVIRVIDFIMDQFQLNGLMATINTCFPNSFETIVNSLTTGTVQDILIIAYYLCLVIFLFKYLKKAF